MVDLKNAMGYVNQQTRGRFNGLNLPLKRGGLRCLWGWFGSGSCVTHVKFD